MEKEKKNLGGQPPKYKTPEELQQKLDEFFDYCKKEGRIPLQGEMAYFLGFASRQSLYDYEKNRRYSYIIRRAKQKCENELNQKALLGEANPLIAKLNLATNYGYNDKKEIDVKSGDKGISEIVNDLKAEFKNKQNE